VDRELEVAVDLASVAGQTIMKLYYGKTISWSKPDTTKITNADVDTERFLVDELEKHFPTHSVLTEESQETPESRRRRLSNTHVWIIDPVDGTDDLDKMSRDFAINIAYVRDGQPHAAVVCLPAHGKMYTAQRGEGAYMHYPGGFNKIVVSARTLEESIITISQKSYPPDKAAQLRDRTGAKGHILQGSRGVRICAVAEGIADFTFVRDMKAGEWDSCGPGLILEEAGGRTTDYEGRPHTYNKENPVLPTGAVFSNGVFHERLVALMREFAPLK
jgi:3'(2'),5'-bisphosphate nucleotidase